MIDVERVAERLLDETRSVNDRAIDLFEFQIAVFRRGKKPRRRARKFAALKVMESVEKAHRLRPAVDIERALKIEDYKSAFLEAVAGSGWRGLRKVPSDAAFDYAYTSNIEKSQFSAKIIEFFLRYEPNSKTSISLASWFIRKNKTNDGFTGFSFGSRSAAKARWAKYKSTVVLIYVLTEHYPELLAPAVRKKSFFEKLTTQAENTEKIMEFFLTYNRVVELLNTKNLKIAKKTSVTHAHLKPKMISYAPLSNESMKYIATYKSADE